jgi:hypothetical protein
MSKGYILVKEVYPAIKQLLALPDWCDRCKHLTIHLEANDVVRLDFGGVMPEKASEQSKAGES